MKEFNGLNIGFVGGDLRDVILMKHFQGMGAKVFVLGSSPTDLSVSEVDNMPEFLHAVDVVMAPMPGVDKDGNLKGAFLKSGLVLDDNFFQLLGPQKPLIIGVMPDNIYNKALQMGANIIRTAELDEIAVLNAIPTAEGAIQIALAESKRTLFGSKAIMFGLGRIGRILGRRLVLLGTEVYGVARRPASYAWGQDLGIKPLTECQFESIIPQAHFVFNTVPGLVVDEKILKMCKKDVIIIDLASAPGGVDFDSAKALGLKALLALGLPGKMSPESAGEILCQEYPRLIQEARKNYK